MDAPPRSELGLTWRPRHDGPRHHGPSETVVIYRSNTTSTSKSKPNYDYLESLTAWGKKRNNPKSRLFVPLLTLRPDIDHLTLNYITEYHNSSSKILPE